MSDNFLSEAERLYVRNLQNPYAVLCIVENPDRPIKQEANREAGAQLLAPLSAEKAYVKSLQNPYASLCMDDSPDKRAESGAVAKIFDQRSTPAKPAFVSKKMFADEARAILIEYVPRHERGNGRLRPEHNAFILRNSERAPDERSQVLERLKRYDLRSSGVSGYFNREDSFDITEKLAKIEKLGESD